MSSQISQETLRAFFAKDRFAAFVGIELLTAGDGFATVRLALKDHHRNGLGIVHGGTIFTLADFAFAVAVNSRGRAAVAIHCSISYLKAPSGNTLLAEAREVSCGPKIALYRIQVTEPAGELVASFEGMAYRKKENWTL